MSLPAVNDCRTARVAELLTDFQSLQRHIATAPAEPANLDDYYTEGWAALHECAANGRHILECAADTTVPVAQGGAQEQTKAELKQILLDAFSRRHQGQKIYLRQAVARRWIACRDSFLRGQRPHADVEAHLAACDDQLRAELGGVTDHFVYRELAGSDRMLGRWTDEDPSMRDVQCWLRAREPRA